MGSGNAIVGRDNVFRLTPCRVMAAQIESRARIGVIGGGFAGLSTAAELEKNGIDYILLEASNRLGGRVYPIKDENGGIIQLGAEYINGVDNDIYKIAERLDIIDMKEDDYGAFQSKIIFGIGGGEFSRKDLETWKDFAGSLEKDFYKESETFPDISVGDIFQRRYNSFIEHHQDKQKVFDALASLYRSYYETEWSSPIDELALSNFQEWDDRTNSNTSWTLKGNGFAAILEELKKNVNNQFVRLNSRVSSIDWSENYVTVTLKETGDTLNFDHVIVTVPLGFLKRNLKLFHPRLPKKKRDTIKYLGFGSLQKIFLEYDRTWWDPTTETIMTIRLTDEKESKLENSIHVFQVLSKRPNTLLLWLAAEGPKFTDKLSNKKLGDIITEHLRTQFNNSDIPKPKNVYTHNWNQDDLIGGAYSYITPTSYENLNDSYNDMATPVEKDDVPLICFAGEHTHPSMYQTTVGAYESGIREAKRLINYLNKK